MIQTVLSKKMNRGIGHVQCHEHIWLNKGASYGINHALCADSPEKSLQELKDYYAAGGGLIVDAQPAGCGRSAKHLKWLSQKSGVEIVSVSGFHKKAFFDDLDLWGKTADNLAAIYSSEILEGMYENGVQTDIKAGMLKVGMENDWNRDPVYVKLFEAVAIAAVRTNAPIMVHTEPGNDILELLEFFKNYGISSNRIMICHLDRTHYDVNYHKRVLQSGCYFCYDSIHRYKYISAEKELDLIKQVLKEGYEDQIVISLDTTGERLRAYDAKDMGLDYILKTFINIMQQNGISQNSIKKMCEENAMKILDFN